VFRSWINFLKRPPRAGGRKDIIMSQQQQLPESPGASAAPAPPDVSQQIAALTDAVNRLVKAQRQQPSTSMTSTTDIGGDVPGGAALLPAVDVARLFPVQQIALGLRDAKPVGPAHPAVLHATGGTPRDAAAAEAPPVGAD
jgi:hypothetical protein